MVFDRVERDGDPATQTELARPHAPGEDHEFGLDVKRVSGSVGVFGFSLGSALRVRNGSELPTPKMRFEETLALTPALSPR